MTQLSTSPKLPAHLKTTRCDLYQRVSNVMFLHEVLQAKDGMRSFHQVVLGAIMVFIPTTQSAISSRAVSMRCKTMITETSAGGAARAWTLS
jgi:hypothetical protein